MDSGAWSGTDALTGTDAEADWEEVLVVLTGQDLLVVVMTE